MQIYWQLCLYHGNIFSNLGIIENSFVANVGITISQKNFFYFPTMKNKEQESKQIKKTRLDNLLNRCSLAVLTRQIVKI